jgi:hypothetical protein
VHAVVKYHAITLMMRFYEHVFAKHVDAVTMDKLTKDPFKASIRTAKVIGPDSKEIIKPMFETCLWSNAVAFLSDYTVHQIILAFTYYIYCRERKRRMILEREEGDESSDEDADDSSTGAIAMTFGLKSCKLMVSRGLGLVASAAGGAYGSYLYPGWGCTIGSSLGDGLMSTALEERT